MRLIFMIDLLTSIVPNLYFFTEDVKLIYLTKGIDDLVEYLRNVWLWIVAWDTNSNRLEMC